jgi:hypothetical protein
MSLLDLYENSFKSFYKIIRKSLQKTPSVHLPLVLRIPQSQNSQADMTPSLRSLKRDSSGDLGKNGCLIGFRNLQVDGPSPR